jgi:Fe2+ or Zn2+ uptake regulation protein
MATQTENFFPEDFIVRSMEEQGGHVSVMEVMAAVKKKGLPISAEGIQKVFNRLDTEGVIMKLEMKGRYALCPHEDYDIEGAFD